MSSVEIIYRYCPKDSKANTRPAGFKKRNAFINAVLNLFDSGQRNGVNIRPTIICDDISSDIDPYESIYGHKLCNYIHINEGSNEGSYRRVLEHARVSEADIIYLLEDDYWHISDAMYYLLAGVRKFGVITGYFHPDRITRNDDITKGQEYIGATNRCIWTTNESTTCTYMFTKEYKDIILTAAEKYLLNDREMWRSLKNDVRLWAPTLSISTHCDKRFMAPYINWHDMINYKEN